MPKWLDWIHPSYRDLIIEELANDPELHLPFLETMSLPGITLAISDSGGATGDRCFPLMTSRKSWDTLHRRCAEIVNTGSTAEITTLLRVLRSAAIQTSEVDTRERLVQVITSVCEQARDHWDRSGTVLTAGDLDEYCEASLLVSPLPALPKLDASWQTADRQLQEVFEEGTAVLEPRQLSNYIQLAVAIQNNEPRFLRQVGFPGKQAGDIMRLLDLVEDELRWELIAPSAEEMRAEADHLTSIAELLEVLSSLIPAQRERAERLTTELKEKSSAFETKALELEPPEPEDYDDHWDDRDQDSHAIFDVESLFSDL